MSTKWQAVRCLEENAPDYWIVTTRPIYRAPVLARCDDQESAETIARCVNACEGINPDAVQELLRAAKDALSDLSWAEKTVPGTNFQASIILLRAAIDKATHNTR